MLGVAAPCRAICTPAASGDTAVAPQPLVALSPRHRLQLPGTSQGACIIGLPPSTSMADGDELPPFCGAAIEPCPRAGPMQPSGSRGTRKCAGGDRPETGTAEPAMTDGNIGTATAAVGGEFGVACRDSQSHPFVAVGTAVAPRERQTACPRRGKRRPALRPRGVRLALVLPRPSPSRRVMRRRLPLWRTVSAAPRALSPSSPRSLEVSFPAGDC
mmetsp:Transcript_60818/g.120453  ORF Transcript_60818/g.120453 Transcript_60818/m.120453 type:complete len:215 (+) Transcript_60818:2445-3089(+)